MKWFKHDSCANMDGKLQEILLDYGLEGYGLYWYCLELISGKVSKDNITFELDHDARIIARNTGSTVQKVQEMMGRFIDLGLFENNNGAITCYKLATRLDKSMTSNPEMREIIGEITNQKKDLFLAGHDGVMTKSEKVMKDQIRSDQIRLDKIKKDNKRKKAIEEFESIWIMYERKGNKKTSLSKYLKLKDEQKLKLSIHLPKYVESTPDKKFRKNFETYINQECWEDEILTIEKKKVNLFNIENQNYKEGRF